MPNHRKPIQHHMEMGNYRKDRHGELDKVPSSETLTIIPSSPRHLNRWGKEEWDRLTKEMIDMELLQRIDLGLLEQACMFYGIFRSVSIDLSKQPNLFKYFETQTGKNNNILTTLNTCYKNYSDIVYKMGCSPIERQRIQIEKKKEEDNPFARIASTS